jgi:hypothetical protein
MPLWVRSNDGLGGGVRPHDALGAEPLKEHFVERLPNPGEALLEVVSGGVDKLALVFHEDVFQRPHVGEHVRATQY